MPIYDINETPLWVSNRAKYKYSFKFYLWELWIGIKMKKHVICMPNVSVLSIARDEYNN